MARKSSKREQYKAANGSGTVYERPNGRWQGQVTIGVKADGSRRRMTQTFPTNNEAVAWVRELLVGIDEGTFREPSNTKVLELLKHWKDSNPQWSEASINDNIGTLERHVMPMLGKMRAAEVTPGVVQTVVNELRLKPAAWPPQPKPKPGVPTPPPNPPLSEAMIRRILSRLRAFFNHGIRMKVIAENPALGVRLPKVEPQPSMAWTVEEAQAVVAHCLEHDGVVENYLLVALATGLRVQELRGLPWSAVDLAARQFVVRQVAIEAKGGVRIKLLPKTPAGFRVVDFDDTAMVGFERQRVVTGGAGLVFGAGEQPLDRGQLRRAFIRVVEAAGAPVIPVYDTRATHGTLLAEAGVNPKIISERLGHTDVAFSMRVYVRPGRVEHRAAAGVIGSLLQPAATHRDLTADDESQRNPEGAAVTQETASGDSA